LGWPGETVTLAEVSRPSGNAFGSALKSTQSPVMPGTADCVLTIPGRGCEENGHRALTAGFPFCSTGFATRAEHLWAPFFLQHAGTSLCRLSLASAGNSGPAPNKRINEIARIRRKAFSEYRNAGTRARNSAELYCGRLLYCFPAQIVAELRATRNLSLEGL
jgi:hypothetical protein